MAGPLRGVRVIDLTTVVAGPYATVTLADQGADVIKVEAPGMGDLGRFIGAMTPSGFGFASTFLALNRAKRSIVLDLKTDAGAEAVRRLAAGADVLVHNFRPGVAERFGLGAEALMAANRRLTVCEITGFGDEGPLAEERAYDPIIQAMTGMAALQGGANDPALIRQFICDKVTGLYAAQAVTAALYARGRSKRSGRGRHVQVSLLDASATFAWVDMLWSIVFSGGAGPAPDIGQIYEPWPTRDGALVAVVVSDKEFAGFARALDLEAEAARPEFANMIVRFADWPALRAVFAPAVAGLTTKEALDKLLAEDVPAAAVSTPDEVAANPQLKAMKTVGRQTHPQAGPVRLARAPALFDGARAPLGAPAAAPGADGRAVLEDAGFSADEIAALAAAKGVHLPG